MPLRAHRKLNKPLASENGNEVRCGNIRPRQILPGLREGSDHQIRNLVVNVGEERVRRLSAKAEFLQFLYRKVAQIPCEYVSCADGNAGRHDVSIIRVGQVHCCNMLLVPSDHGNRR